MGVWQGEREVHRKFTDLLCSNSPEGTCNQEKIIFMDLSKPKVGIPEVGPDEKKKKSLRQGDLGCKYPFLGICDASHSWQD